MTALTRCRTTACRKTALAWIGVASLTGWGTAALHAQAPTPQAPAAPAPQVPGAASPAKTPIKAAVAARISTLGLGLEGSALVTPNIALRVGFGNYSYSHTASYQDVKYDGKLKLNNVSALADLYPSQRSGFHATAGLVFDNNQLTAHGKPDITNGTQTYTLNGTTYNVSDVGNLDGKVTFSKTAPYLGIGFGKPSGGGAALQFLFDLGVVFQGKPNLTLTRSGGTTDPTISAAINTAVSAQRDKTQSDVNKFQYYPVVSFGLAYGF